MESTSRIAEFTKTKRTGTQASSPEIEGVAADGVAHHGEQDEVRGVVRQG
jgi:hypothetical protein